MNYKLNSRIFAACSTSLAIISGILLLFVFFASDYQHNPQGEYNDRWRLAKAMYVSFALASGPFFFFRLLALYKSKFLIVGALIALAVVIYSMPEKIHYKANEPAMYLRYFLGFAFWCVPFHLVHIGYNLMKHLLNTRTS